MPPFHDWLDRVLTAGESVQDAPPRFADRARASRARLRTAFELHALDVAGPPVTFDPGAALRAATALAQACWVLVTGDESEPVSLDPVASASANLSSDVTLSFLPTVYRRARSRAPDGPLATQLDGLLRAWPLSGVLADLDGTPTGALDFGGHTGLQLLYAERLVSTGRVGWVPPDGSARAWAERIFAERGRPIPVELSKDNARA